MGERAETRPDGDGVGADEPLDGRETAAAKPLVVLVHGIGVSSRYFARLRRALAADADVLAPDLAGFGGTPRADEPLTIAEHADTLAGLLERAGAGPLDGAQAARGEPRTPPATPALLVGHSMGAQVVTELAIRRPDLCGGLVLLGPVVDPAAPSPVAQGLRLLRDAFREPLSGIVVQVREYLRTGLPWYLRTALIMCDYRLEERLPLVEQPLVLVRGAKDPVTPSSFLGGLAEAIGADAVEIPGAAHLVMWSRPRDVAALCLDRLRVGR